MKKYEFHSTLPPEQVFARLSVRAKERKHPVKWEELGVFLYHRDGEILWLAHTGEVPTSGFVPFSGPVRAEGTGSIIFGGFSVFRAMWKPMAIMGGLAFVLFGLLFQVPVLVLLLVIPLWLLCAGFFSAAQPMFFGKRRKAILRKH